MSGEANGEIRGLPCNAVLRSELDDGTLTARSGNGGGTPPVGLVLVVPGEEIATASSAESRARRTDADFGESAGSFVSGELVVTSAEILSDPGLGEPT